MWRRSGDGGERLVGGHGVIVQPALRLRVAFDGSSRRRTSARIAGTTRSRSGSATGAALRDWVTTRVLARLAREHLRTEGAVIGGWLSAWMTVGEKADRAIVALSMRLRISPQARMRRETTAPKGPPADPYDLLDDADG